MTEQNTDSISTFFIPFNEGQQPEPPVERPKKRKCTKGKETVNLHQRAMKSARAQMLEDMGFAIPAAVETTTEPIPEERPISPPPPIIIAEVTRLPKTLGEIF